MTSAFGTSDDPHIQLIDSELPEEVQRAFVRGLLDRYAAANRKTYGVNSGYIESAAHALYPQQRRAEIQTVLAEIAGRYSGILKREQFFTSPRGGHFVMLQAGRVRILEKYVQKPNQTIDKIKYLQAATLDPDLFMDFNPEEKAFLILLIHGRDHKDFTEKSRPSFVHLVVPCPNNPWKLRDAVARIDLRSRYADLFESVSTPAISNMPDLVLQNQIAEAIEESEPTFGISLKPQEPKKVTIDLSEQSETLPNKDEADLT